jgi:hypothetical protein
MPSGPFFSLKHSKQSAAAPETLLQQVAPSVGPLFLEESANIRGHP